ncbi:MAG: site-specific integrase [Cytophagales bacterium]|nr:site-specific integrase [Cytophagales bacterium]
MISVYFFPKKERLYKDGTCPVFMQISFNGNRIRRPVQGVNVKPQHWLPDKHRIRKPNKNEPDNHYQEYNTRLDEIQGKVAEAKKHAFLHRVRITEKFILDWLYKKDSIQLAKKFFLPLFDEYLNAIRSNSAKRTIMGKTTVRNFIKDYQDTKGIELHLSDFDGDFFEQLRNYAYTDKKIGVNYFAKIIATLKTFLHWATDKGHTQNQAFRKYSAPERETEIIYLTDQELKKLYQFDFSSPRLAHVRDVYCFCCFTGLRISDVKDLNRSHIQGDQIIKVIQKTQDVNAIPLSKHALDILNRYKGTAREPLPKISSQKFNVYIKDCCEKAGIDAPTTIVRFSGGTRITEILPKHKLITSHTARKTFATNSLIFGMTEMVVRNTLGHKKEESFRRYVKIADNVKRTQLNDAWNNLL